jgi:hypothetical protein
VTASLLINDNALSNQQDVELSGNGISGPSFTVAPSSLDFGNNGLGVQGATQTVTVTNTSPTLPLVLPAGSVTLNDAVNYKIVSDNCSGLTIDAGAQCTIKVAFDPQHLGTLPAELTVAPQGAGVPKSVDLMGVGTPAVPDFSMNPANNGTLPFGNQVINTISASKSIILTNSGTWPLTVTGVNIVGPDGGQFAITADTCLNNPGIVIGTCTITVVFHPNAVGSKQAQIQITDNAPSSPQVVNLTGTGVPPNPLTGYWLVAGDGGVFSFGTAHFYGSTGNLKLAAPVVGMASTPDGKGYWLVASDGGIFAFGDAPYLGSMGGHPLNSPVVGMAATPDGGGYWEVASDGGIFSFGDAQFYGSMGGKHLNQPVTGMTPSADGGGYWLVASDGGVFTFGDVQFYGSMGGQPLNKPVVGIVRSAGNNGYLISASDGGIFAFGDAPFYGSAASLNLKGPIVGVIPTASNKGYWQIASDGGVFAFGDAPFVGSLGAITLNQPMVGGTRSFTF